MTRVSSRYFKGLATLVCVLFVIAGHAQLTLRPMIGINSSRFTTNFDDEEFKSQVGYQIGADLMMGGRLYFAPGALIEVVKKEAVNATGESGNVQLTRLNVPLHFGYKFFDPQTDRTFDVRLFAGPNMALNISKSSDGSDNYDIDQIKDAQWGWDLGVGVDFLIFFIEAQYRFGLSEVFKSEVENSSKNDVFSANAGVRIRF